MNHFFLFSNTEKIENRIQLILNCFSLNKLNDIMEIFLSFLLHEIYETKELAIFKNSFKRWLINRDDETNTIEIVSKLYYV